MRATCFRWFRRLGPAPDRRLRRRGARFRSDPDRRGEPARPPRGAARSGDPRSRGAPRRTPPHRRDRRGRLPRRNHRCGGRAAWRRARRRRARPGLRPDVRPAGRRRRSPRRVPAPCSFGSATASIPPCRRWSRHLDLVARRDLPALRRLCGVDDEDLAEMLAEMRQLDPKPGRAFGGGPVEVLIPDVFVRAGARRQLVHRTQPGRAAPRSRQPDLLRARVARRPKTRPTKPFLPIACRPPTGSPAAWTSGRKRS